MKSKVQERDLRHWKLFGLFREHLEYAAVHHPSLMDRPHPRRELDSQEFLAL